MKLIEFNHGHIDQINNNDIKQAHGTSSRNLIINPVIAVGQEGHGCQNMVQASYSFLDRSVKLETSSKQPGLS